MRISNYKAHPLLLLAVPVFFATARWVAAADETNRMTADGTLVNDGYDRKEIPAGFKPERYARLWQRNPFAVETPVAQQVQPSLFDKLFLAGWQRVGGKEIVFVQNSETNEVQRITAEPNQNSLRLVDMHLDTNPRLVQAVITNGTEQGIAKFRLDTGSTPAQTVSAANQTANNGANGQTPQAAEVSSRALPGSPTNPQNAQNPNLSAVPPMVQAPQNNYHPGIQRVRSEGDRAPLQRPQTAGKHVMPGPTTGQ